jgi:hypothetical protein
MYVVDITDRQQIDRVIKYFRMIDGMETRQHPLRSIRVGIDPLDNGLKFSVDYSTWSPPMVGDVGND